MPDTDEKGTAVEVRCRCVWADVRCPRPATQEDALCDWCGTRRPEDTRDNPKALIAPDGEFMGLGGGGDEYDPPYEHQAGQAGIPNDVRPTACWMAGSGRCMATEGT